MSYGRSPYYIYSDGDTLYLSGQRVSEEIVNAFLYKVLLTNRREELKRRLKEGKSVWKDDDDKLEEQWMEECEDDIVKKLMSE